jgi:Chalcone isomerase N-terminal domain
MIKSIVMMDLPLDDLPNMERWYYGSHSSEIARRYGPWLERHESYPALNAPEDARRFGFYNWRVTETFWRETPEPGPKGAYVFTPAPVWNPIVACAVPAQPNEDFFGWDRIATEGACIRWYMLFRYPRGVRLDEGEDWYVNVHAPEVMKQPGLRRFFSFKACKPPVPLPGMWHPKASPPDEMQLVQWDRVTELWYDSFSAWRNAVVDNPPAYTLPEWATDDFYPETIDTFPFFKPGVDFVSTFLLERPSDEFLRDTRYYLP